MTSEAISTSAPPPGAGAKQPRSFLGLDWQLVGKSALTFTNQGLVSLFHFAIAALMVRFWGRHDFGVYAFVVSIVLTLESMQGALVGIPLSVYLPTLDRRVPRQILQALLSSVSGLIITVASLGGFLIAALTLNGNYALITALAVGAFVASRLLRAFSRSYFYARLDPLKVAVSDLIYVGVGSGAILLVWWGPQHGALPLVLGCLALAATLGAVASMALARVPLKVFWRRRLLRRYAEPWRHSRWALVGVTTTTLQTGAHTYIVTAAFGPETFAILAAGQLLFRPISIAMMAWGKIARPYLARAFGRKDKAQISRTIRLALSILIVGFIVFLTAIYNFWEPIQQKLYGDRYEDMSQIVALWAIVTALVGLRSVISFSLQAMRAFRELAFVSTFAAIISLSSVGLLTALVGFEYSIAGLVLGEIFVLGCLLRLYRRHLAMVANASPPIGAVAQGERHGGAVLRGDPQPS